MAAKYPGVTERQCADRNSSALAGCRPTTENRIAVLPPLNGATLVKPTARIPGAAASRPSASA